MARPFGSCEGGLWPGGKQPALGTMAPSPDPSVDPSVAPPAPCPPAPETPPLPALPSGSTAVGSWPQPARSKSATGSHEPTTLLCESEQVRILIPLVDQAEHTQRREVAPSTVGAIPHLRTRTAWACDDLTRARIEVDQVDLVS